MDMRPSRGGAEIVTFGPEITNLTPNSVLLSRIEATSKVGADCGDCARSAAINKRVGLKRTIRRVPPAGSIARNTRVTINARFNTQISTVGLRRPTGRFHDM